MTDTLRKAISAITLNRIWHSDPHGDIPCYDAEKYRKEVLAVLDKTKSYDSMNPYCGCGTEGHEGPCYD